VRLIALTSVLLFLCLSPTAAGFGEPAGREHAGEPPSVAAAGVDFDRAHTVEAAYLLHLAHLTEWPGVATRADEEFEITIVGNDPGDIAGILERNSRRVRIQGRPVRIRQYRSADVTGERLRSGRILFVTEDGLAAIDAVETAVGHRPVLVAGQTRKFLDQPAAMVAFYVEEGRVRIQVDPERARAVGLRFSAELLQHAVLAEQCGEVVP
jgi:hypothetical protein